MTILFLHGGPGLDASAERAWFRKSIPVDWWDQPAMAGIDRPFWTLCAAAEQRLEHWHAADGAPVPLLAHSFGAAIAHVLCLRRPELISRLVLLTPLFDPLAVLRCADGLPGGIVPVPGSIHQLAARARSPGIFDCWWSSESAEIHKLVMARLSHGPHFDADSYAAIAFDYITHRDSPPLPANVTTMIVFGTADQILRVDAAEDALRYFPRAEIRWMPCAHQPLFELTDVPLPNK
jgi:pimeloyl-ACP methyl ester carboxylesterase